MEGCGTKNSAVYSMRGTLQYRFTTARVQWPCSTDIHWACLITQSGPARYVPNWLETRCLSWARMENRLRVRTYSREAAATAVTQLLTPFGFFPEKLVRLHEKEDQVWSLKKIMPSANTWCPSTASQQPECNGPAPQ